jgi:hypothetical protein
MSLLTCLNEKRKASERQSMNPLEFAGEVILVSASGVLSPGPLFTLSMEANKGLLQDSKLHLDIQS